MAGASLELDIRGLIEKNQELAEVLTRLAAADQAELLDTIGASLESQTKERFEEKAGPDGQRWKQWSDGYRAYQAKRFPGASILVRRGELQSTITHNVEVTGDTARIVWGSNMVYAAVHQWGYDFAWGRVEARPYLGINGEDMADLRSEIEDWLRRHGGAG